MKNQTRLPATQRPAPLDFTPVPRKRHRRDGWTPERQRAFIAALADTGSVTAAAAAVNMRFAGAYALYHHPDGASFRAAFDHAISLGVQRMFDLALDRVTNGVVTPIIYKGEQTGECRVHSNILLNGLLRYHAGGWEKSPVGRRSQAAIERHAAENCPTCRERREAEAAAPDEAAEQEAATLDLLRRYTVKVGQERRQRRRGEVVAADFTLRQLTWIEFVIDRIGAGERALAWWHDTAEAALRPQEPGPTATLLARLREQAWADAGDWPGPAVLSTDPGSRVTGGPTATERHAAQADARRRQEDAQAMWEAAAREETWAAWQGLHQPA